MAGSRIRTRRWTRQEYDRLIELDVLHEDDPIELVAGRLVVAEPQRDPHARAVELVAEALRSVFGGGWRIRVQLPLTLGLDSQPEPDVSVVRGTPRDVPAGHPLTADLVVEVADSSLRLDRGPKARVYARAGITDYWIVNLVDRVVEVYRLPGGAESGPSGYRSVARLRPEGAVAPLSIRHARIPVADLLPSL